MLLDHLCMPGVYQTFTQTLEIVPDSLRMIEERMANWEALSWGENPRVTCT